MNAEPISDALHSFILQRIDSVTQLEIILLLHTRPDQAWTAQSLARELRVSPTWTAEQLALLAHQGFVARQEESFRYRPDDPTRACIAELAAAYATHRIAVVNLIYSKPNRVIKSFADAFRFRRPDKEPPHG